MVPPPSARPNSSGVGLPGPVGPGVGGGPPPQGGGGGPLGQQRPGGPGGQRSSHGSSSRWGPPPPGRESDSNGPGCGGGPCYNPRITGRGAGGGGGSPYPPPSSFDGGGGDRGPFGGGGPPLPSQGRTRSGGSWGPPRGGPGGPLSIDVRPRSAERGASERPGSGPGPGLGPVPGLPAACSGFGPGRPPISPGGGRGSRHWQGGGMSPGGPRGRGGRGRGDHFYGSRGPGGDPRRSSIDVPGVGPTRIGPGPPDRFVSGPRGTGRGDGGGPPFLPGRGRGGPPRVGGGGVPVGVGPPASPRHPRIGGPGRGPGGLGRGPPGPDRFFDGLPGARSRSPPFGEPTGGGPPRGPQDHQKVQQIIGGCESDRQMMPPMMPQGQSKGGRPLHSQYPPAEPHGHGGSSQRRTSSGPSPPSFPITSKQEPLRRKSFGSTSVRSSSSSDMAIEGSAGNEKGSDKFASKRGLDGERKGTGSDYLNEAYKPLPGSESKRGRSEDRSVSVHTKNSESAGGVSCHALLPDALPATSSPSCQSSRPPGPCHQRPDFPFVSSTMGGREGIGRRSPQQFQPESGHHVPVGPTLPREKCSETAPPGPQQASNTSLGCPTAGDQSFGDSVKTGNEHAHAFGRGEDMDYALALSSGIGRSSEVRPMRRGAVTPKDHHQQSQTPANGDETGQNLIDKEYQPQDGATGSKQRRHDRHKPCSSGECYRECEIDELGKRVPEEKSKNYENESIVERRASSKHRSASAGGNKVVEENRDGSKEVLSPSDTEPAQTQQQKQPARVGTPPGDKKNAVIPSSPPPGSPSGLTRALVRLADLEAQMEYAYAKHMQVCQEHEIVKEKIEVLEKLPVGYDAFKDDLEKLIAQEGEKKKARAKLKGNC